MSDTKFITGKSPEEVAHELCFRILADEKSGSYTFTRDQILDTYAECLHVVRNGHRKKQRQG